jgi:hypothetical protein
LTVIALVGRRIDAPDADPSRFPLANVALVESRLRQLFVAEAVRAIVSSAACGADLLAQTVAGAMGKRRRVVLPFERGRFRKSSVVDRPGDWGSAYDRLLAELDPTGDVVTLPGSADDDAAYAAANGAILDKATAWARQPPDEVVVTLVWDGASRGMGDLTAAFGEEARKRGLRVAQVSTR